jgi:CheY-like chemotaxis protein/class 3 adenylate cyclase
MTEAENIKQETILVVDDNKNNLDLMLVTLSDENYRLLAATSGERALKVAQKVQPDLILMDIQMPGIDGYETALRIKNELGLSHIPILFLSALNDLNNIVRCFASGGVDYISKPFKKEELLARVRTHLALKQLRGQITRDRDTMFRILNNIIPKDLIEQLKLGTFPQPKLTQKAFVLFTDFAGFTAISKRLGPNDSITQLNQIFSAFDEIILHFHLERVKTIGDAYMAVGGINTFHEHLPLLGVLAGLKMQEFLKFYSSQATTEWKVRIGAHIGPVISGIIGHQRIAFDVWGDTVNIGARLESVADTDGITISVDLQEEVKKNIHAISRGEVHLHNWGEMEIFKCLEPGNNLPEGFKELYESLKVEDLMLATQSQSGMLQAIFNVQS